MKHRLYAEVRYSWGVAAAMFVGLLGVSAWMVFGDADSTMLFAVGVFTANTFHWLAEAIMRTRNPGLTVEGLLDEQARKRRNACREAYMYGYEAALHKLPCQPTYLYPGPSDD